MKTKEKDILQNIEPKHPPYAVPEGYFALLEQNLKSIPGQKKKKVAAWKKMTPYVAIAATFALIMAAGGFFLGKSWTENKITEQYAEVVTEDDILEYLIYTGVEIEELEQY